jgi:hypothetical protein
VPVSVDVCEDEPPMDCVLLAVCVTDTVPLTVRLTDTEPLGVSDCVTDAVVDRE